MNEEQEQWHPVVVPDWPELSKAYLINKNGYMKRAAPGCGATIGKHLTPVKTKDGYVRYGIGYLGRKRAISVHRLVAYTFLPNPENKPQINHKNGIRDDNRLENLEWATNRENNIHACRVLARPRKKVTSKRNQLTAKDIKEIRMWWKTGSVSMIELSHKWKTSFGHIRAIVNGNCWRNVA